MLKAIFPGSFDPPTYGHFSLVERASRLFDELDVIVAFNSSKKNLFTNDERLVFMKKYCANYSNVKVLGWSGLIVEYARSNNIHIIIRGLRPLSDFAYEFELATLNHQINPEVETLFLPTESKYSVLRSSSLKEMAILGVRMNNMTPPEIYDAIIEKLKTNPQ